MGVPTIRSEEPYFGGWLVGFVVFGVKLSKALVRQPLRENSTQCSTPPLSSALSLHEALSSSKATSMGEYPSSTSTEVKAPRDLL